MNVPRMHHDESVVDDVRVRELLTERLPHLAHRPLRRLDTWGTDHVVFRWGDDLAVRVPKIGWAAGQGAREARWLPVLAPHLPVEVAVPVAVDPAGRFTVTPWIEGSTPDGSTDLVRLALDLAAFVRALRSVDTTGAPAAGPDQRGGPLAGADAATRAALEQLRGETDVDGLLDAWAAAVSAPPWSGAPCWVHGDLMDGNLLLRDGRLAAVIDWGGLVVGDPAVDLVIAWSFLDATGRDAYRAALEVDDVTWLRGRAWAVSAAVQALPYYRLTNPEIVARSWRAVEAVLAG